MSAWGSSRSTRIGVSRAVVFDLAWTHSQVLLQQLNATEADAQLYGHLASTVIYANPLLRADASLLGKNRRGQSGLWGYSISGDFPIVLLQIADPSNIELVRQLVQAHAYWRLKGLAVDLVIWNEDHAGYRQLLQEQIAGLIAAGLEAKFTIAGRHLPAPRRADIERGPDSVPNGLPRHPQRQPGDAVGPDPSSPGRGSARPAHSGLPETAATKSRRRSRRSARPDLFQRVGGFTPDGREYVISTAHGQETPGRLG